MSAAKPASERLAWHLPDRMAYVVNHSFPYSSDGYAVRTHEVARALAARGHEVIVFNRPGRPWDIEGFAQGTSVPIEQVVDSVRYIFLPLAVQAGEGLRPRLRRAEAALTEAFAVFRPAVVLAASNWENAEPAQNAARRTGAAFYYEQRGFWEMSADSSGRGPLSEEEYETRRRYELRIATGAKAVFTLNTPMQDEVIRRGVAAGKVHLVPNGVGRPMPVKRGVTRKTLGITARWVLGYVGSLSAYEGVEDLLHLVAKLRGQGLDVAGMIVGSSAPKGLVGGDHLWPEEARLRAVADRLGVAGHIAFVPQVAWDEVGSYYALSDAIIMPRKRSRMTEMVAPIKPYAAAAYDVPIFMTDMPPLDEIAADTRGQVFPEGDVDALAAMVARTLQETDWTKGSGRPLPREVYWDRRVEPMARLFAAEADAARQVLARTFADAGGVATARPNARFDIGSLPAVRMRAAALSDSVLCVGPGAGLKATPRHATRASLLGDLATLPPGRFVVDWLGLEKLGAKGEWAGLWSVDHMALNRQIMDACRIALDRGWQIEVTGPVQRMRAPLYRTVAGVVVEIAANGQFLLDPAAPPVSGSPGPAASASPALKGTP